MNTTVTIDQAGRVVLPKTLRDELRLEAGDTLQLESEGERVTLSPIRSKSPLRKERGVWVFNGGGTLSVGQASELVVNVRERRNREILGEKP
ncbi:MAG: AbrB/MazE/SpoVT family DNA-binding domain-containing protein [Terriglobia bacterium]|jgi:AbrB family looped-hinge helix DNA binding protein